MSKKGLMLLGMGGLFFLFLIFGFPDQINIFGFNWCIKNCEKIQVNQVNIPQTETPKEKSFLTPIDLLNIKDLKPRQKIYSPDELATVDFFVEDERGIPYNITVNWFNENIRYHGWYNESNTSGPFFAWYTTNKVGEWKIQVVLRWDYLNKSYSKDEITLLEVS